jgi:cystathionine beta-lyase/cystathionine gamma-synthase
VYAGAESAQRACASKRERAPVGCPQTLTPDLPCAGGHGAVSSPDAVRRLQNAEERAEELKAVAAERGSACCDLVVLQVVLASHADAASETSAGQRVVQLEVQCAELESANAQLLFESQAAARSAAELRKAREKLNSLSQASDLAGHPRVSL